MINNEKTLEELKRRVKQERREKREMVFRTGLFTLTAVGVMSASFAVPFGITAGGLALLGRSPFKYDDIKRPVHRKIEFTSSGREETKQYAPFDKEKSVLYYYDAWENKNNQFVSSETTYDISGLTYSEVISHIGPDENITLGTPISKKTIYKENVTEEEKTGKPSYKGVIYECDENDFIITPQTKEENSADVGVSAIVGITLGLPLARFAVEEVFNPSGPSYNVVRLREEKKKKRAMKRLIKKL